MKKIFAGLIVIGCCLHHQLKSQPITNRPAKNTATVPIPTGATVLGVFDGRSPCQDIARELNVETIPECIKIKWRLTLFQDSITQAPTEYKLEGFVYRNPPRKGKWRIVQGTKANPKAVVIQLDPDSPTKNIFLLKADQHVLFFLDKERRLMVGNENFSYTLYRTEN